MLASLAILAGCQGLPRGLDNDPLTGGAPITRSPAGSLPTVPRSPDALVKDDLPPVPPANTTTSPAALTTGAVAPVGDRRPAASVTLGGPRPSGRAAPPVEDRPTTVPSAVPPGAGGTYEDLQQQLLARGVVWQQLKSISKDEWEFICAIPDPQQPSMRLNFTARAPGPNGLAAIRLALEKIDLERR